LKTHFIYTESPAAIYLWKKCNPKNNIGNHGNITKGDYKFIHGSILAKIWPPWLEGGMGPKKYHNANFL